MKKGIEKEILEIAKAEFFEKGYKGTSMRSIAKKTSITLSNTYYYFENKDALFLEIVKPLKAKLDMMFGVWHNTDTIEISIDAYTNPEYQQQSVKALVELAIKYKEEFKLLLFQSQGSALENIKKTYIDSATQSGGIYMKKLSEKYTHLNIKMSEFFIRTMSAHTFTIIGEIVSQDLSTREIEQFMKELVAFNTSGWKGILYINKHEKEKTSTV